MFAVTGEKLNLKTQTTMEDKNVLNVLDEAIRDICIEIDYIDKGLTMNHEDANALRKVIDRLNEVKAMITS